MKSIAVTLGLMVSLLLSGFTHANNLMEDKYTYEVPYESAAKSFALGMVDRHLTASCQLEMQSDGTLVITDYQRCVSAAQELEQVFDGQLMELPVKQRIRNFFQGYLMQSPV